MPRDRITFDDRYFDISLGQGLSHGAALLYIAGVCLMDPKTNMFPKDRMDEAMALVGDEERLASLMIEMGLWEGKGDQAVLARKLALCGHPED